MHDIRLALALMALASVAVFLMTIRLLRSVPRRGLDTAAVVVVLLMAAYVRTVWGQLWIVKWIPLPSVIVLSNWFPLLLAMLGGIVWLRLGGRAPQSEATGDSADAATEPEHAIAHGNGGLWVRRTMTMSLIVAAAVYSVMYFIPLSTPNCGNEWDPPTPPAVWPVCKQTTDETCSAASSATILNTLGIQATEQEMARLCLTGRGTTWLGLYHGLSTKLMGTNHTVEFFEADVADLPKLAEVHPLLLCCQLDAGTARDIPEYVTDGGWRPGTAHSVVYFGAIRGRHVIGDPARGYEVWTDRDLDILWTRQGLRIGHRKPPAGEE